MLRQRVIAALLLAPPVIAAILLMPTSAVAVLFGLIILLGGWEWSRLAGFKASAPRIAFVCLLAIVLAGCWIWARPASQLLNLSALAPVWWVVCLVWVAAYNRTQQLGLSNAVAKALIGYLVLVPSWTALVALHDSTARGPQLVLFLVMLAWVADIGAYFSGKAWGKHKLAPQVSPGKSVEGVLGGGAAVVLYSAVAGWLLGMTADQIMLFIVISLVADAFSVLGDLFESMFKRSSGFKDSGALIPGHGGVLDRIDSVTAAAPVFACGWVLAGGIA